MVRLRGLRQKKATAVPRRRYRPPTLGQAILFIVLLVLAVIWLVPFFFTVTTALKSQKELLNGGIWSLPSSIEWKNFTYAWTRGQFGIFYKNTMLVTFLKVPLGIFISSLAAYSLSKTKIRFGGALFLFFLAGLTIPKQVTLLPIALLLKDMGLLGSIWALFPPYIVFGLPFQILVLRGFFNTIPEELSESAQIDGASNFVIYSRIVMPLSIPALATLAIIDFLGCWSELVFALVLLTDPRQQTIAVGLTHLQGEIATRYTVLNAGVLISIIPVLVAFVFFQRYLVSGLTSGAIRG
jgi:raffinose/stachyose/melibiose transport system permease protein